MNLWAGVVLQPSASPASATAGNSVTVTGSGFPAGAIPSNGVSVTLTPPAGNGAPVTVLSTGVTTIGANRLIRFTVPPNIVANAPLACSVSVSGSTPSAYTTTTPSSLTVNPTPGLSNVAPGAGAMGTTVNVVIAGNFTTFGPSSVVSVGAPGGITVSNVTPVSTTQIKATLAIAAGTTPGARAITVTTGSEAATISAGFIVSASPGLNITGISPGLGAQGTTLNVALTATGTHWDNTTFANFGDGILVNSLSAVTPTSLTANVTINPLTYTGTRMVTVVTNTEFAVSGNTGFPAGFIVVPAGASLTSILPNSASQATNLHVKVAGTGTHFLQNATTLAFGSGINIGNTTVTSATTVEADIAVGPSAPVGAHDVTVTTGGETETLAGGFTVSSSTPYLLSVTPTSGAQGATVPITVTGVNTAFSAGNVTADFGSNITVAVTVNSATSLSISAVISLIANTGSRTVLLHAGGTDFPLQFTVTPSGASILSVSPPSGPQGVSTSFTVTGSGTHWVQGTTAATIVCCSPASILTVNRITVNSPTSAVLDITIPAGAPATAYTLTMSTGGEVVSAAFSVFANSPTLTVAPGSGKIGTTVPVNLTGQFTHFVPGTTTLNITGQGVTISGFTTLSAASAVANFAIDPAAAIGPRTLTMTTGTEIVTTTFAVTSTPAVLTSINPYHSSPSTTLDVTIGGQFTNFVSGTTTVGFGPNVTVNSTTVLSSTSVKANITIDALAAFGWRTAFAATGAEQLQIGFRIDSPASPLITSVSPSSGFQGQTVTGVTVTGTNTHWSQGTTQLILGAGVTVANLTVNSATSLTADISISPTAPIGGNSVITITGSEVASGTGFSVQKGAYQILSLTPNLVTQNQTLKVAIVGQATHWLQGGTIADFGPNISVDTLTITDATHALAQITILSQAAVGLRTVSLNTSGEVASINNGLDVEQGTPTLLSSIPNSGLQGETKTIQVLGRFTHWVQGATQASYSSGIIVNSVTVVDSATASLNVTVDTLAYIDTTPFCRNLALTTGTEQVSLQYQFCIGAGPAQVTQVRPATTPQGSTLTLSVIGQNTHWSAGITTASLGGGVNVSAVHVTDPTHATVDIAATVSAPTGLYTVTLSTLGENASMQNAFTVTPGVPTLNGVSPVSAQQGTTVTLHIISQFTHFGASTTATFGPGITLNSLSIVDSQTANANITIDPLAFTGSRIVTMTTGSEIVSGNLFSVVPSPAIISAISPSTGNQGQEKVVTITGQGTHWAQGLTQFSMAGAGFDITINSFIVNSATSATVDFNISPTAGLGARGIYISTAGEVLTDPGAFVVTGGIPSITYLSPSSGKQGVSNLNVTINGVYTNWNATSVVDFGQGITLAGTPTVNSSTSITAVINIDPAAALRYNPVTVRTGAQTLSSQFLVVTSAPPTPYISYFNPSAGVPGQTFNVNISGAYTHWDLTTGITFGAGVHVNTFQTTSPTSALVNITIDPAAAGGSRSVTLTTTSNGEIDTTYFSVVIATPYISIIDPGSALQGETGKDINVIGQYTLWTGATTFNFGAGVTVNSVTVLGPAIARVNVAVAQLATLGSRSITATTGAHVDNGCCFSVSPSLANITSVSPNTAMQNDTPTIAVVGQFTHWIQGSTVFTFGGFGISVTSTTVTDSTHATLVLALAPLATLGTHSITASTSGEIATLNNAFVVQPGTPLILSSAPSTIQQQNGLHITILGQFTNWVSGGTTIGFGAASGITVGTTNVTSATGITADITAAATTALGYRTLYVTTGGQVLSLPNAIYVTNGPAAITGLTPPSGNQGAVSLNVAVLGTNTNFVNGVTTANFGQGVSVNSITVTDSTHATVNVTISASATAGNNAVSLTTNGETAGGFNFLINAATPVLLSVTPSSGTQGDTADTIAVVGAFTHFTAGLVTASFGPGTSATVAVTDNTHATVTLAIQPGAATGARTVTLATAIGSSQESATWTGHTFTINPSAAAISLVSPASGSQNQTALQLTITGTGTHFDNTSTASFSGGGITPTLVQVLSPTSLQVTVNIDPAASVSSRNVTVTTSGETATLAGAFSVTVGTPAITTASPVSAHQNDTVSVAVSGIYTHFVNGTTTAGFGAGITVNSVTITSATAASVNLTIAPTATLGARTITLTTGGETATLVGGFNVTAGVPQISSITPVTGAQASTQTLTVNSLFTNFVQGTTVVSFSGGNVTAGTATVNGPTQLTVSVTVAAGANATARTITVTTGSETESLTGAFTVLPGSPTVTQINPTVGVPNTPSLSVAITGQFTNFVNGTTQVTFGPGISVNGAAQGAYGTVSVSSATTATATISVDTAAVLGARDVTVKTGAEIITVNNGFTVQSTTPTAPTIISTSPTNGFTGSPINTSYKVVFSGPIDPATVLASNTFISASYCNSSSVTPATLNVDASGRILTITPSSVLAVGTTYYFGLNETAAPYAKDPAGHQLPYVCNSFTTGFAPSNTGPTFVSSNVATGDTNVGTNVTPILGFDKAIDPSTQPAGLTVFAGATPIPGVWGYNASYTQATFTPAGGFAASTVYTVNATASLKDSVGNALVNPTSISFTTGAGADTTAATLISYTPVSPSTTGENPTIRIVFSKAMNPLSLTQGQFYLYNYSSGHTVVGTTVTSSPDRTTFTMTLPGPLDPGTSYYWYYGPAYDQAQHYVGYSQDSFLTGTAVDNTPPTVTLVSPPNASTGVPVNSPIGITLSEPIDLTSVNNGSFTLTPAVPGALFKYANGLRLSFTPTANLAANQTYTINASGFTDQNGNPVTPFSSTFTTSASSAPDTTRGTITMVPASGATAIPTNASVVFTFSKAYNPQTVAVGDNIRLYDNTASTYISGTIALNPAFTSVTFTPKTALEPNHQYCGYGGYPFTGYIYDLAGNTFNYLYSQCFTTAAGTDTTAPTIISMMPLNNATGIGPNNPITLTFSKPMNPTTLNSNTNAALYSGSALISRSFTLSFDATTLTFSGALNYGTTYTVIVTPSVTDLAGNHLAAQYTGTFSTIPQPVTTVPTVTTVHPAAGATGVPATAAITIFVSEALNTATVPGALKVSQNGVLITGNITYSSGNQVVVFQPSANLLPGALIQVFFQSSATDLAGNPLTTYMTSFTVAPDLTSTAPVILSTSPTQYSSGNLQNSIVEVQFSKPLAPATVTNANFYVRDCSSNPVTGTLSLRSNNTVIRFVPAAPFPSTTTCFYVYPTSGLKDVNNLAFAGTSWYEYYGTTIDTVNPTVLTVAPTNGATGIGTNATIRVAFSKAIDPVSVDITDVSLTSAATPIPYTASFDSTHTVLTITPQAALPPSSPVSVALTSSVTDTAGNVLTAFNSTFTTAATPDFVRPVVISTSVMTGQMNVPVNSAFTVTLNKPIDTRTAVANSSVYLYDNSVGYVPVNLSFSPDGTQLTFQPQSLLPVNRSLYFYVCGLQDLNGNVMNACSQTSFTTALVAPSGGPQITFVLPSNGLQVPTNFKPEIQFDRPVDPTTLSGVTLAQGVTPVPFTNSTLLGGTVVLLTPNSLFTPNLPYTLTITGVKDSGGTAMTGTVSRNFTTGPSFDLVNPAVSAVTPASGEVTGTHPVIRITLNEPINPIASNNNWNLTNNTTGVRVPGTALVASADLLSESITYPGNLDPNTQYCWSAYYVYDLAGNQTYTGSQCFTTSSSADTTAPTVISATPPNGQPFVPLNALIQVVLSKPIDATTVNNTSLFLTPAAPSSASVSLSSDGLTMTLNLAGTTLSASTAYTLHAAAFKDLSGNTVTPFSSTFTTSAVNDTAHGTISLTSPAQGATGVSLTAPVVITLSKVVEPNSVNSNDIAVFPSTNNNQRIPGTIAIGGGGTTLTFTPSSPMPPSTQMYVYAGYYSTLYDLAFNNFSPLTVAAFTTASTPDTTAPTVLSVSPANGTTNVGPNAVVTLIFSKALNYNTINNQNFTLYNGFTNLGASVNRSADNTTVTLTATLPYSATITAAVSTNVQDQNGNSLAAPYSSTFTTETQPLTATPTVTQMRPANGASGVASNNTITLYFSAPLNASTVPSAFYVSQNGALISGTVATTADGRSVTFTGPGFQNNANIQVFFTGATDTSGNPVTSYSASFTTVAAASATTTLVSALPAQYSTSGNAINPVIDLQFSRGIQPATAVVANFYVLYQGGGSPLAGAISQYNNNTVLRFTPSAALTPNVYYYVYYTAGLHDISSNAITAGSFYFYTGATANSITPTVTSIAPFDGATNVGDNATIRFSFSEPMDTLTINSTTVTLKNGGTPIPFNISFAGSGISPVTLTPLSPLPDNATVTFTLTSGINDQSGHAITAQSAVFQTGPGADFTPPQVMYSSIDSSSGPVPTNATFTLIFNKPLDRATLNTSNYYYSVYDNSIGPIPSTITVSPDGKTVTYVPTSTLTPTHSYELYAYSATDLNGNAQSNFSVAFTTGAGTDTNAPQVLTSNPANNATGAPLNASIEFQFNEAVRGTSLTQLTLMKGASAVPFFASLLYADSTVHLTPSSLLQPNTTYTVTAQGVQDIAGNTMVGTYSFTFTTGPNVDLNATPNVVSILANGVPLTNNVNTNNIPDNPTFVITFDTPVEPASLTAGGIQILLASNTNTSYPFTVALSADQKTATVTLPAGTLGAATQYQLRVGYAYRIRDWAASYNGGQYYLDPFTTQ